MSAPVLSTEASGPAAAPRQAANAMMPAPPAAGHSSWTGAAGEGGDGPQQQQEQEQQGAATNSSDSDATRQAAASTGPNSGATWYRALWERTVLVGERQEHAAHPASSADVADEAGSSSQQQQAGATSPVLLPYTPQHSSLAGATAGSIAAAGAAQGTPLVAATGVARDGEQSDSAAFALDTASVADSAMTLEDLREREAAASGVSNQGYLSPGSISAVSSTTGGPPPQQQQRAQQQQGAEHSLVQQRSQQALRRQDSASMQGPFGDEPEQHVLHWQQQLEAQQRAQLVAGRDPDVDSDTLLVHRGLAGDSSSHLHSLSTDTAGYDSRSDGVLSVPASVAAGTGDGRPAAAAAVTPAPLATVTSATVTAGSALPAAERNAALRESRTPFLGQDSDYLLLARGAAAANATHSSAGGGSRSSRRGAAGPVGPFGSTAAAAAAGAAAAGAGPAVVAGGSAGGPLPAAVLTVEPRIDSAREWAGSSGLPSHAAAASVGRGTTLATSDAAAAEGAADMSASGSGRLVRVDSALDTRQVLGDAAVLEGSALPPPAAAAVVAGGPNSPVAGSPIAAAAAAGAGPSSSRVIPSQHSVGPDRSASEVSSLLLEARRVVLGGGQGAGSSAAAGPSAVASTSRRSIAAGAGGGVYPDEVEELYSFADSLHDENSLAAARRVVLGDGAAPSSSGSRRPASLQERAGAGSSSSSGGGGGGLRPVLTTNLSGREYVLDSPRERAAAAAAAAYWNDLE